MTCKILFSELTLIQNIKFCPTRENSQTAPYPSSFKHRISPKKIHYDTFIWRPKDIFWVSFCSSRLNNSNQTKLPITFSLMTKNLEKP